MTALELVRFALYADLGMAFGVPAAAVLTQAQGRLAQLRPFLTAIVLAGLPLSCLGYALTVAEMAGTSLSEVDRQLAVDLATGTSLGWAFLARITALLAASAWSLIGRSQTKWLAVSTGIALASLTWGGHAAAGEGLLAMPRLAGDIVHIIAASIWLGALVLFLAILGAKQAGCRALSRFSDIGSVLVGILAVTGLANLWSVVPPAAWRELLSHPYGVLLVGKLALFAGMLALASLNRFMLVPRLSSAQDPEVIDRWNSWLKVSIGVELAFAMMILVLVSRLGLSDPGLTS